MIPKDNKPRGSTIIELAIIIPLVLLPLTAGVIELGIYILEVNSLGKATRNATRFLSSKINKEDFIIPANFNQITAALTAATPLITSNENYVYCANPQVTFQCIHTVTSVSTYTSVDCATLTTTIPEYIYVEATCDHTALLSGIIPGLTIPNPKGSGVMILL